MMVNRRAYPADAVVGHAPAPDGWPLRFIRYAEPAGVVRGSILFMGGRGDHFEKYIETLSHWHATGWQVESVDWRGQGGSGRLSDDPHVGHADDFAPWVADLADWARQWQACTPAPHIIMGHSMGGHLLLRALAERAVAPDAAVLVAPMLGFAGDIPLAIGHFVARLMCRIGPAQRPAWSSSEKPGSPARLRQYLLTHDDGRYADEQWWHAHAPQTVMGPASWRWVDAAYRSLRQQNRPGMLEHVAVPVLILSATRDQLVSARAIRRAAARLPHATLHEYGADASHELLREVDNVRDDALARIGAFLREATGAAPGHAPILAGRPPA
ncbi:MAG: alpha/beta hydrolase [Sphingopyxis sp.]